VLILSPSWSGPKEETAPWQLNIIIISLLFKEKKERKKGKRIFLHHREGRIRLLTSSFHLLPASDFVKKKGEKGKKRRELRSPIGFN